MSLTNHQIATITQSSIKGPATFKTSQSCHTRKVSAKSKTYEAENLSPYKVQEAVYSILEKSDGNLERASQLLDERLNAANRMIRELSESGDSLSHDEFRQRMRLLKSQHRNTVEMTEDLRTAAAAAATSSNGRSVAFNDAPTTKKPPLPPSVRRAGAHPDDGVEEDEAASEARRDQQQQQQQQQDQLRSRVKALWSDFDVHSSRQRPRRSASLDRAAIGRRPGSAASAPGERRRPARRRLGGSQSGGDEAAFLDDELDFSDDDGCSMSSMSWRHRVTVPRPFSMTLREEAAAATADGPPELRKSRSMRILAADVQRQREAVEAECRVRPKAAPVPGHVYQPLLRELEEQREARRREVREHSAEILRATERPFSFTKREAERKRQGRDRLTEADRKRGYHRSSAGDREATVIRARPAPASCSAERARQLREEAELRRERARARSEANLRRSAMPGDMAERQRSMEARRGARLAAAAGAAGSSGKQAVGRDAPDFDRLHRQFQLGMLERQAGVRVTRPEPFRLLTEQRARVAQEHTEKCLASDQDPRANRTLYDYSLRYPTDSADDADASEMAAERERRRRAEMKRPEDAYSEKLRELDRKMKERDQLIAEQARLIAQQNACSRYRQSLLQAGVEPARVAALVNAYRERELATFGAEDDNASSDYFHDGFSSMPNESELDEDRRDRLDETRFGAPSPVPQRSVGWKQ